VLAGQVLLVAKVARLVTLVVLRLEPPKAKVTAMTSKEWVVVVAAEVGEASSEAAEVEEVGGTGSLAGITTLHDTSSLPYSLY
jgi:hypothetical protein